MADRPPDTDQATTGADPGLKLEELIDVETLQEIQDAFSAATGVASVITDPEGRPITRTSNFCRLCADIIRKTPRGLANCMASDAALGRSNPDGPTIQHCLSGGLWDGGASITVGDRHIANWLAGQVMDETVDREKILAYVREIGADEEASRIALDEVTRMPRTQFEHVCRFLFIVARQISDLAYRNMLLKQEIEQRRHAEEEFREANEELSAANEELVAADEELRQQFERLQEQEQELRESEGRFREVLENAQLVAVILDPEGRITFCNQYLLDLTGWRLREVLNQSWFDLFVPEEERAQTEAVFRSFFSDGNPQTHHVNDLRTRQGTRRTISWSTTRLRDAEGKTLAITSLGQDITERKRNEQAIRFLAYHDQLTGLPNRLLFFDRVTQAIARAKRTREQLGILFIDLDDFKRINDSVGHNVGDELLRAVAQRLEGVVRTEDTVARMGGDEFTVLVVGVARGEDVADMARRVVEILREPFRLKGQVFDISASIGIALYPGDGEDVVTLLKHADTAMYAAKESGRNHCRFFTPAMNDRIEQRMALDRSLRRALDQGELVLHYQPQVELVSGRITGLEALIRWQHPERGLIPPDQFIPLAEETGMIVPLGEWVLRAACAQNRAWQDAGLPPVQVSVNLAARQFQQRDLLPMVERILGETGLDPAYLGLEITESATIPDAEVALQTLLRLKSMGVKVSLDDFGTGYSALSYLRSLPIDVVKLDKSFIHDLASDEGAAAVASAVILLAHHLKLKVVAEGVETWEQLSFLRQQRCDAIQGYIFSRPLPVPDVERLLRTESQASWAPDGV